MRELKQAICGFSRLGRPTALKLADFGLGQLGFWRRSHLKFRRSFERRGR
jgi:hypothetical protein